MAWSVLLILDGLAGQACGNLTDVAQGERKQLESGGQALETHAGPIQDPKRCGARGPDLGHQCLRTEQQGGAKKVPQCPSRSHVSNRIRVPADSEQKSVGLRNKVQQPRGREGQVHSQRMSGFQPKVLVPVGTGMLSWRETGAVVGSGPILCVGSCKSTGMQMPIFLASRAGMQPAHASPSAAGLIRRLPRGRCRSAGAGRGRPARREHSRAILCLGPRVTKPGHRCHQVPKRGCRFTLCLNGALSLHFPNGLQ